MFQLNTLSVLEFTGHDARQFLHNQLSADIVNIPVGTAAFACCCNPAGRVIALLLISPVEDSFYVICSDDLAETLQTWLSRFIIRADVKIQLRGDLGVFADDGQDHKNCIARLETPTGITYVISKTATEDAQLDHGPLADWKARELEQGVVWLNAGSSAQYLPQMLGFESIGALSFNKGCYPGQEIIARTRYLGKLKRRPFLFHTSGEFAGASNDKLELMVGESSFSAVIVDMVTMDDGGQFTFVVARMGPKTIPEYVRANGQDIEITGT